MQPSGYGCMLKELINKENIGNTEALTAGNTFQLVYYKLLVPPFVFDRKKKLIKPQTENHMPQCSMQDSHSISTWIDENVCNWLVLASTSKESWIIALVARSCYYDKRKSLILIWLYSIKPIRFSFNGKIAAETKSELLFPHTLLFRLPNKLLHCKTWK